MEIVSVKVGSPSQATKVSVEAPTQIKATFKDVIVNNGGGSVKSVNGQTGDVILDAAAVGALPDTTKIPANTSELTNNSGFITRTVSDLANYYLKSETYSKEQLDNKISAIPTKLSQLTEDSSHRVVTDTEKQSWNAKADKATTLAGYGITDGATKTEVTQLSEEIADLEAETLKEAEKLMRKKISFCTVL